MKILERMKLKRNLKPEVEETLPCPWKVMKKMVRNSTATVKLRERLMTSFILQKSISCFSHSLQLVVRTFDTVRAPKRALIIAHKLMSKVCKSVKATEKLVSLSGRKLVNDVPTRWNSTFIIISRLLEVRAKLSQVLQELSWNNLQNSEWKQLDHIHSLLKPFAKYTALTSGEDYTTLSMVIPVLIEFNCHLDSVSSLSMITMCLYFVKFTT